MIIRKLIEEDAAAYWALRLEALEREPRSFGLTPEEHRGVTLEQTAALISKPGAFLVGAFNGDSIVGTARFDRESHKKERHKGHVYGVYAPPRIAGRELRRE